MADIYLGLAASGLAPLPPIRWMSGTPDLPTDYSKKVEKAEMLDGSQRFNFKSRQPRRWKIAWEALTAAEFADFLTLNGYNSALYFQNNWEGTDWRQVVITSFEYSPMVKLGGSSACRYDLSITLEEVL